MDVSRRTSILSLIFLFIYSILRNPNLLLIVRKFERSRLRDARYLSRGLILTKSPNLLFSSINTCLPLPNPSSLPRLNKFPFPPMYQHLHMGTPCPPWDLYRRNSSYSSTAFLNCTSQHSCMGLRPCLQFRIAVKKYGESLMGRFRMNDRSPLQIFLFILLSYACMCISVYGFFFLFHVLHTFKLSDWWSYCCLETYAKLFFFFSKIARASLVQHLAHVTQEQTLSHMCDWHRSASPGWWEFMQEWWIETNGRAQEGG